MHCNLLSRWIASGSKSLSLQVSANPCSLGVMSFSRHPIFVSCIVAWSSMVWCWFCSVSVLAEDMIFIGGVGNWQLLISSGNLIIFNCRCLIFQWMLKVATRLKMGLAVFSVLKYTPIPQFGTSCVLGPEKTLRFLKIGTSCVRRPEIYSDSSN